VDVYNLSACHRNLTANGEHVKSRVQAALRKLVGDRLRPATGKQHIEAFVERAAASLQSKARILDAGAGDSPYRHLFSHCLYEATDLCTRTERTYDSVTMKCDVSSIPVEDRRYDAVICTQVLEHVPDPLKALKELYRVLAPGGTLWLSTNFYFEEHEQPYDYFRYTQFGLQYLLEQADFQECRIEWLGGYYGTLSHQLNLARHFLSVKPRDYGGGVLGMASALFALLLKPVFLILAVAFMFLDFRYQYREKGHCIDYSVIAKRPSSDKP
jgi:SAM-dependent methyltransferase